MDLTENDDEYSNNISSFDQTEVTDMCLSIVEDINEVFKQYPSEIESQLGITMAMDYDNVAIDFNEHQGENTEKEKKESTVNVNSDKQNIIIDITEDEDEDDNFTVSPIVNVTTHTQIESMVNADRENQMIIIDITEDEDDDTSDSPIVNLSGIEIMKNPRNVLKIFPKHRSKMEKVLAFLKDKRVDEVVSPHIRTTIGHELHIRDLVILLKPFHWLNDIIIQNYISLLVKYCEDTLDIETYTLKVFGLKRDATITNWSKRNSLCNYNRVVIPINPNDNHWALLVADIQERKIHLLDSLNGIYIKEITLLIEFLVMALNHSPKKPWLMERPSVEEWTFTIQNSPKQKNLDDCGVFTCTNARYFLFNKQPDFTQKDINLLRQRIAYELIDDQIIFT